MLLNKSLNLGLTTNYYMLNVKLTYIGFYSREYFCQTLIIGII